VIDFCGILMAVGSIATLGVSLSVLLVIALLIGMALYDAISVYVTGHMIDLADTVLRLKIPIIFVIPRVRNYSMIKATSGLKKRLEEDDRQTFFIGLGDIVFPGILVSSTFHNVIANGLLVALSVMFGTLLGLALLMSTVVKGKPQAGLPFLCSGAIIGYLVSSYLLFGGLVGITS